MILKYCILIRKVTARKVKLDFSIFHGNPETGCEIRSTLLDTSY